MGKYTRRLLAILLLTLFHLWVSQSFIFKEILIGVTKACISVWIIGYLNIHLKTKMKFSFINFIYFIFWLYFEAVKSSILIIIDIWIRKNETEMINYAPFKRNSLFASFLANAITFTPGTLTLACDRNNLTVHCFSERFKQDLLDSNLQEKISNIYYE